MENLLTPDYVRRVMWEPPLVPEDAMHDAVAPQIAAMPARPRIRDTAAKPPAARRRDLPPRRRLPAFCIALLLVAGIAATRVLLQVHYLTDVIGGMLLGISSLTLAVVWIRSRERRGAGQLATEVNA